MKERYIALIGIGIAVAMAVSSVVIFTSSQKRGKEKILAEEVIEERIPIEKEGEPTEIKNAEKDWKPAQEKFKEWCLRNTAVIEIRFESDWQIWVTLSSNKYTTDENIEAIAQILAGYYKNQSGYPHLVVVTVWSPDYSKYWKGFWD